MPSSRMLTHPPFVLLATGRLVSSIGNAVAPIALAFALIQSGGSAGDIGLVLGARAVAVVASLLFAGVLADRFPLRSVLVTASLLAAAAQAAAAVLILAGNAHVWLLAALQLGNGLAAALLFPATNAALPRAVPSERLQQANALVRLGANGTMIGGAALGGLLVAAVGPGWSIAADALSFVVSAALFAGIRLTPARAGGPRQSALRDLAEGWRDVRSRTWLWVCVCQAAVVNAAIAAGFEVLGPVAAQRHWGGAGAWGIVVAAQGAGLVAGGIAAAWSRTSRPLFAGVAALLLVAPLPAALASAVPLPLVAGVAFLAGAGLEVFAVNWNVMLQRHVPAERLSRVYAYDALGSNAVVPLGNALAGPAQAAFGLAGALWGSALTIAAATACALSVREVRELPAHETRAGEP
ncbi:MFS transporter [Nonomuraea purpurea]|uniref:MFS transporter n=1 Tax=Nonomuraea purpurea TaxID=1849276 RepID=A0ABV8GA66_9ACTN